MRNKSPTTVTIFTNLYTAIIKVFDPKMRLSKDAIWDLIYQNALIVRNDKQTLVLQWISHYSKILENEKADVVAKNVAYKGGRGIDQ